MKAYAQVRGTRSGTTAQIESKPNQNVSNNKTSQELSGLLFMVFMVTVVIWLGVTFALVYHFRKFGGTDTKVKLAQGIYIAGSLVLLVVALFSIL